jgi:F-type H+-transporting ATPase subunit gamma
MGAQLRVVRRRIRSVQSTMKITRAMELIAASRIVKAQQRVLDARPYADLLSRALEDVARHAGSLEHPLLEERERPERAGVLVLTSDRGLAGSYSANLLKRTEDLLRRVRSTGMEPALYVSGKKGIGYFRFRGVPTEASWSGTSEVPVYAVAQEIGGRLIRDYAERRIDALHVVYTDFRSSFTFRATDKRFLPIAPDEVVEAGGTPSAES